MVGLEDTDRRVRSDGCSVYILLLYVGMGFAARSWK